MLLRFTQRHTCGHDYGRDAWWDVRVGPGCVDGDLVYPGIPDYAKCPDPEEAETTLITNWDDCASYFRCYEMTAVLECCPKGLLYDPPMRVCDDPPHAERTRLSSVPRRGQRYDTAVRSV
ncbi:hypothetical protein E2C01_023277 [Portunus trituberculatus]|uniref:Chitin-binding type-2 domain-containing protein n=1 Tax=Portunus trituberculatus TaxID=210409 RepID=A0A5B7EAQ3_PORTR|nr:hypothetical protein [Portunus trituberculatus]